MTGWMKLIGGRGPLALALAVVAVLCLVRLTGDLWDPAQAGIQLGILQLLALGFHVRAATRRDRARAQRRPYWLIAAVLTILLIGGAGFSTVFNDEVRHWTPAMVLALVARTAIVPLLLAALLSFTVAPLDRHGRWKLAMDVVTVLGAGLMVMWQLVLSDALSSGRVLDPLPLGSVLFSVGDVVLLVGVGTALMRGVAAPARRPLLLVLAGTLGYLLIDALFLYQSVRGDGPAALVPTLLFVPMFLFLLAAVPSGGASSAAVTAAPTPVRRHNWLPYLALAAGLSLLVVQAGKAGLFPWGGLVAGVVLMTVGVAARQVLASQENYRLVVTDTLTGLANRLQLRSALGAAVDRRRRSGGPAAVLLLDLDGFKQVNDAYGHEIGDRMLIGFADVLRRSVRQSDVVARLGGDEFAIVLPAAGREQAVAVAERIMAACREPLLLDGHAVQLRTSIGVAVAGDGIGVAGDGEAAAADLLHRADLAMYAAKRRGNHDWELAG